MGVYPSDSDIYISACIRGFGVWEPTETEYLVSILRPGDTYIDIGANIGYYTIIAAAIVGPTGHVYSFEPDPRNFEMLKYNIGINNFSNCTAFQQGISDKDDAVSMFKSPDNMGDHRVWAGSPEGVKVKLARLDPNIVKPGSTIKIDVQGWEAKVILGNIEAIRGADRVFFEFFPRWIKANGNPPLDIITAFLDCGFSLRVVREKSQDLAPITLGEIIAALPRLMEADGSAEHPAQLDLVAERVGR